MGAAGGSVPSLYVILPSDSSAPALARTLLHDFLCPAEHAADQSRQIAAETLSDAAIIASELVTNAVVHGQPPQSFALTVTDGYLLIEVTNRVSDSPHSSQPETDEPKVGGRGIPLIASLADSSWQNADGQTVISRATLALRSGPFLP